ncbi:hypothetical protein BDV12DRAFT_190699 [Aspergillus spectabilis]
MRPWAFTQGHPFTVAWWSEPSLEQDHFQRPLDDCATEDLRSIGALDGKTQAASDQKGFTISLLVRPEHGVTNDLKHYGNTSKIKVLIDGPYGGYHSLYRYGHVLLFTQGIGIAAQMPFIKRLFYGALGGELPTRRISLFWETADRDLITVRSWISELLKMDHDSYNRTMMLNIRLYITDEVGEVRYGRRVRKFYGPIETEKEIREELKKQRGRILITGTPRSLSLIQTRNMECECSSWSSSSSEWSCPPLPLEDEVIENHRYAGPIIVGLFQAHHQRRGHNIKVLLDAIDEINTDIRRFNVRARRDIESGVIHASIFIFAWDEMGWEPHLEAFCKTHNYPVEWAENPPKEGDEYKPFKERYWEECDWDIAGVLLQSFWELCKKQAKEELLQKIQIILDDFEIDFNRKLRELHNTHGNHDSEAFELDLEKLQETYTIMADFLEYDRHKDNYEKCRADLASQCMLYGWPLKWVPGYFQIERE